MHVHAIVWWGEYVKAVRHARCAMHVRERAHSGQGACMGSRQAGGQGACMIGGVCECMGGRKVGFVHGGHGT